MPLFAIFAVEMFLTVVAILFVLTLAAETVLCRPIAVRLSRRNRTLYYTASGICLLLYFVFFAIGRATDYRAEWWAFVGSAAFLLFFINTTAKILFAAAWLLRRRGWRIAAVALTACIVLLLGYGLLWERNRLRTEQIELSFDNLPAEADGVRIVQIGDIHIGLKLNRYRMLERIVARIDELQPDAVCFCGDLIDSHYTELDSTAMAILSKIKAPLGIYSVVGNHDNGMYVNDTVRLPRAENLRLLLERERQMGWTVLVDSTAYITFGGDSIAVTGLGYPAELERGSHGRKLDKTDYSAVYDRLPDGVFDITIAHYPSVWDNIRPLGADLTLAGHVHAMQFKLPIGARGWSPAALVYKYWSGLYRQEGRCLYVNDGTGSGVPVRIGVPPEITLITLRRR